MRAFVLVGRDWREYDKIFSLYSLENGKVEAVAKGVKKITAKNSAYLVPFCFIEAEIIAGKEFLRLGSVQPVSIYKNIRTDLAKSLIAGYAVQVIDSLINPGEMDKNIFLLLNSFLEFLDNNSVQTSNQVLLDAFMARLLAFLGFNLLYDDTVVLPRLDKEMLLKMNWAGVNAWENNEKARALLHAAVYRFAVFYTEKKLGDWGRLPSELPG